MNYKVLLVDDQINDESIQSFILNAKYSGIEIIPCQYHDDGIQMLKEDRNYDIDAVILDATGFSNQDDENLSNTGLRLFLNFLKEFSNEVRLIPWFVFTGASRNSQLEFKQEIQIYQKKIKYGTAPDGYYTKTLDEELLLEDVKYEIDRIKETELFFLYRDVFSAIQDNPNLIKHKSNIFEIIKSLKSKPNFTLIRKILESLFVALSELRIIPEGFTQEQSWINGTSRFLSGIHDQYQFKNNEPIVHPCIGETVYRVLNIIQDGSHSEGKLRFKVDEYHQLHTSGYLYRSVVYALFEIIVYFGDFIKNNQDIDRNQERWEIKQAISNSNNENWKAGVLIRVAENGYGTFQCDHEHEPLTIVPYFIKKYNLRPNQRLEVRPEFNKKQQKELIQEIKII